MICCRSLTARICNRHQVENNPSQFYQEYFLNQQKISDARWKGQAKIQHFNAKVRRVISIRCYAICQPLNLGNNELVEFFADPLSIVYIFSCHSQCDILRTVLPSRPIIVHVRKLAITTPCGEQRTKATTHPSTLSNSK